MEQTYCENFCHVFYQLTSCPIHLVLDHEILLSLPDSPFPFVPYHLDNLLSTGEPICYTVSASYLTYGLVRDKESSLSIILGPYTFQSCTFKDILYIMKEYSLPADQAEAVTDYFHFSSNGVFTYFKTMLSMVNFFLNHETLDIDYYLPSTSEYYKTAIAGQHAAAMMDAKENLDIHNTYELEQMIYKKVEDGDAAYFRNSRPMSPNLRIGKIADNNLRQAKNLFIVSTALATRAAIRGGMPMEESFQLSDKYIQTMEKMNTPNSINQLSSTMLVDFTERVAASKIPTDISPKLHQAMQYIQLHTNCKITVQDVADAVGLSRSSISRRFKADLGFDMSSFIMRCKLEEAKSLLAFSDKSLGDISSYLCFSSQSYFNNVFKQTYNMTPKEYRIKNRKKAPLPEL